MKFLILSTLVVCCLIVMCQASGDDQWHNDKNAYENDRTMGKHRNEDAMTAAAGRVTVMPGAMFLPLVLSAISTALYFGQ